MSPSPRGAGGSRRPSMSMARTVSRSSSRALPTWPPATSTNPTGSPRSLLAERQPPCGCDRGRYDREAVGRPARARDAAALRPHRRGHEHRLQPDGALIATASEDRTVRVWDAATRDELRVIQHARRRRGLQPRRTPPRLGSRRGLVPRLGRLLRVPASRRAPAHRARSGDARLTPALSGGSSSGQCPSAGASVCTSSAGPSPWPRACGRRSRRPAPRGRPGAGRLRKRL